MNDLDSCFVVGNRCLLMLMKERFLVSVLSVDDVTVRVSFPTRDFPIEGMYVELEFHDANGYTRYETEVLKAPEGVGDGLILKRPFEHLRTHHRSSWRVPVEFDADVKSHVHPRKYSCRVLNLSIGGMLLSTHAPFELGETVESTFEIPGSVRDTLTAKVVHVDRADGEENGMIGLEFISPDPVLSKSISQYIWGRVKELHPPKTVHLRQNSPSVADLKF
ncbi:MAG: PilZ domain-containing protein [Candidatus Hydrogenedentes bacterium]|nr:PilZ domain-containing protein [Candidatus Hydrogenedentota bacterium]